MSLLARFRSIFAPLDTGAADASLSALERSQHDVKVRARALRMDISCGDPGAAIDRIATNVRSGAGHLLRAIYAPALDQPLPDELTRLLRRID